MWKVFGWGYNGNGQLGIGNNVNQPNPCRISALQGTFITQVSSIIFKRSVYTDGYSKLGLWTNISWNLVSTVHTVTLKHEKCEDMLACSTYCIASEKSVLILKFSTFLFFSYLICARKFSCWKIESIVKRMSLCYYHGKLLMLHVIKSVGITNANGNFSSVLMCVVYINYLYSHIAYLCNSMSWERSGSWLLFEGCV